jgi:hypothetical protein
MQWCPFSRLEPLPNRPADTAERAGTNRAPWKVQIPPRRVARTTRQAWVLAPRLALVCAEQGSSDRDAAAT